MIPTYIIEYQVADASTEVGFIFEHVKSTIAGSTRCRLIMRPTDMPGMPVGPSTLTTTEALSSSSSWVPIRIGLSARLIRAMFFMLIDGPKRRPYGGDGVVTIDLGYLDEDDSVCVMPADGAGDAP